VLLAALKGDTNDDTILDMRMRDATRRKADIWAHILDIPRVDMTCTKYGVAFDYR
jgi:hypothetical protein